MSIRTKPLGRTGIKIGELSFGAAAIGNLFTPLDDQTALSTAEAAWQSGIRFFDTAPHYGLGLSERRLGQALRSRPRTQYVISTKVGRLLVAANHPAGDDMASGFAVPATHRRVWDFSADGIRHSIESSLQRLGLDRLDIVLLHDPDEHMEQALSQAYPALASMREQGLIGAIGAGMNQAAALARLVRETDLDIVLVAGRYTLLDQTALDELLPEAQRRGVAVVVGGVFNSGLLADPKPSATFDYGPAPEAVLHKALQMQNICQQYGVPLRAAAVRFSLTHPAVASVLIGARTGEQIRDAVSFLDHDIPDQLWTDLRVRGLIPGHAPIPQSSPQDQADFKPAPESLP